LRHILGNDAETRSSLSRTILHRRFAGKLVRELIHFRHSQCVLMSRSGERCVPMQGRQPCGGAIMVGGIEKGLICNTGLREGRLQRENKKKREQQNNGEWE
jgi:hypothetical protein